MLKCKIKIVNQNIVWKNQVNYFGNHTRQPAYLQCSYIQKDTASTDNSKHPTSITKKIHTGHIPQIDTLQDFSEANIEKKKEIPATDAELRYWNSDT